MFMFGIWRKLIPLMRSCRLHLLNFSSISHIQLEQYHTAQQHQGTFSSNFSILIQNKHSFSVADFGCIMDISTLAKDVVAPYPHMVESYSIEDHEDPYEARKTLLFFRGRTQRKDEGKIRAQLYKMLNGMKDVIYEEAHASEEGFKASAEQMRSSKFCLHPAGDTSSSCRLFDAIVSHCIPVIVSDKIELPLESEIDYKEFFIFLPVDEALKPGYLVEELRNITKEKWTNMWLRIKSISHHFEFQYPPKNEDAVNMIWR